MTELIATINPNMGNSAINANIILKVDTKPNRKLNSLKKETQLKNDNS